MNWLGNRQNKNP